MAEMTTAQKQALGGMNISSDEEKLEELKAIAAKIKAEEARIKANIAEKKAAEANAQADEQLIAQARGLTGDRDGDGNLIPAAPDKGLDLTATGDTTTSNASQEEEVTEVSKIDIEEIRALDFEEPIKLNFYDYAEYKEGEKSNAQLDEKNRAKAQALADKYGIDIIELRTSPEWQSVYGDKYDDWGLEIDIKKSFEDEEIDAKAEAKWQELMDIDPNIRTDEMSEKMRHGGIDPEEGRTKPVESEARGEKPGWEMEEGSNTWSVNEKDDYWKTQEGFDEAIEMYGKKPAWVKEPTLIWNPETQEYEEVEEEEFEDLSRPAVSADIKKLFG